MINEGAGTGTILNEDGAIAILVNDVLVRERGHRHLQRGPNSPSTETVTVDVETCDVTAQAGYDYTAVATTLSFAPGETLKTVFVTLTGMPGTKPTRASAEPVEPLVQCPHRDGRGVAILTTTMRRRRSR